MSIENNRYGGTGVNLDSRKQVENQPTDEMIEMITKAGKWARYIYLASFLGMISLGLMLLPAIFLITQIPQFALVILPIGGLLFAVWNIYSITKRYADLALHLGESADVTEDMAICFKLHTSFIKFLALFTILMFVLALVAAIIVPAFTK